MALRPPGRRKVLIFIHGYNTDFAEALYRLAQLEHDSELVDVPVLFTWPSRASLGEYVYDSNSATAAHDELAHTLELLFASHADQVNILAHSMGNWVTVEALRQLKIAGQLPRGDKLGHIFLAALDIDLDVFKSQLRVFKKPIKPFYVVVSKDDEALQLSSFIAGGKARLDSDPSAEELTSLGVTVVDLTKIKSADPTNHGKYSQLAEVALQLLAVLAQGVRAPRRRRRSSQPRARQARWARCR